MKNTKRILISGILVMSYTLILSSCQLDFIPKETSVTVAEQTTAAEQTTVAESDTVTTQSDDTTVSQSEESVSSSESGGGNPDNYTEINITISESRYYYDNSEISLEELTELFDSLDKNDTVNIHDDYASDKAFEDLTSILEEREIPYTTE